MRHHLAITICAATMFWSAHSAAMAVEEDFGAFLQRVREEGLQRGFSSTMLDETLNGLTPDPTVWEKLKNQPEVKFSFAKYVGNIVSAERIKTGKAKIHEYKPQLSEASDAFKVPPEVIAALWGVETHYGRLLGNTPIVRSLATLAYDSHRREFFRQELFGALEILHQGHIRPNEMIGSWAGAMGQCQFMPSSFIQYAVDGDNDGRKDIWSTQADVFASTANYLSRQGWKPGEVWGQRVVLSKNLPRKLQISSRGLTEPMTAAEWAKMGVKPAKGHILGDDGRLFLPEGPAKKVYLVYNNFNTIMRWNNSSYFAFSVLSLADELRESGL